MMKINENEGTVAFNIEKFGYIKNTGNDKPSNYVKGNLGRSKEVRCFSYEKIGHLPKNCSKHKLLRIWLII